MTENYDRWVAESPEWFTNRLRRNIPIYMIPTDVEAVSSTVSSMSVLRA